MLWPLTPPVPHVLQGADPVDVRPKHVPQPAPHHVAPAASKMACDAAAVYTPDAMPSCHANGDDDDVAAPAGAHLAVVVPLQQRAGKRGS